ncbi:CHASE2 domain-containing protein [Argonema galeatum]|uniref:CHASE2 domain-containing protein n=1 Tax=Argonema galeatum TaxID=2942762 RepID=UPI00201381BB|nr:CHASE2 domain-containing protein [Argonema galeatum]MCL1466078.1 CHASE2 domain-containing protein [Argonema galeatum A003/A1]
MSYCLNPKCPNPSEPKNSNQLFCSNCGWELILQQRYRVIQPLGKGGCGEVFEVDDKGTPKVLKRLSQKSSKFIALFQQEARVLTRLRHPGIPKVEKDGYFQYQPEGSRNPIHCLVMEKIEGLNLEQWLEFRENKPIGEEDAIVWLLQLIDILEKLHQSQYFHRDIKPSNIMLKPDGQLVLIDFGTVREITDTYLAKIGTNRELTSVQTFGYTPSEQINGKPLPQSDFFALGRTFVHLLTGKELDEFEEDKESKILWRDSATHISKPLTDLIDWLMEPSARKRPPNAEVIRQCLKKLQSGNGNFSWSIDENINSKSEILEELQSASTVYLKPKWRGWQIAMFSSALATSLVMGVRYLGWLQPWEMSAFDRLMQMRPPEKADTRILVITVDEKDLQYQDEKKWNRKDSLSNEAVGLLWQKLTTHKPRVIGLNIFRPTGFEPKLANAIQNNDRFIATCAGADANNPGTPSPPGMPLERLGFADMPDDGLFIRRQLLTMSTDPTCNTTESFNMRVAESYLGKKLDLEKIKAKQLTYNAGGYQLPAEKAQGYQILINYRKADFQQVKLREILDNYKDSQLSTMVRDRIVLIGAVNEGDMYLTPYSKGTWPKRMPGVVIQAHMISQLISADLDNRSLLWWWPEGGEILWIWIWSLVGGIFSWQLRSPIYLVIAVSVAITMISGLCFLFLLFAGWIPLVPSVLALASGGGSFAAYAASKNKQNN